MPNLTDTLSTAATSFTSGVSALPGGFGTISNVVDNAKGAINSIPGAAAVSGLIGKAAGALSGVSLSSLTAAGLPAGAAAQMNSAIAAISSGGSVPIKMPTVATGTFDRGEMSSLMASLGSPKIPMFSAAGNPATFGTSMSAESIKKFDENKAAIAKAQDEYWEQQEVQTRAWAAWDNAQNNLPQGDPQIGSLKTAWLAEGAKKEAIQKKIDDLRRA